VQNLRSGEQALKGRQQQPKELSMTRLELIAVNWSYVALGLGLFAASAIISLAVIAILLVSLPSTFFLDSHQRDLWIDHHPVVRWSGRALKNLAGVFLILLGVVLSVPGIPGQGILTILLGIVLLDFPGKRRLERSILKRPRVRRTVEQLRHRFGRPPFMLEEESVSKNG
jgi:hypothetical protein